MRSLALPLLLLGLLALIDLVPCLSVNQPSELPLGVATIVATTNRAAPEFVAEACPTCGQIKRYQVIEQYEIVRSNVVPAMIRGKLHHLPVGEPTTNRIGIYTSNRIDHPAVYKPKPGLPSEMTFPPLPPDPAVIYREARAKMVPPSAKVSLPTRANMAQPVVLPDNATLQKEVVELEKRIVAIEDLIKRP